MLSEKTRAADDIYKATLEESLLITTHGCVAKECRPMLLVPKIPERSGCYFSSFRLYLYVQITNTTEQKQQISLTQYTSLCIKITALNIKLLRLDFVDLWLLRFIPLNLEIVILFCFLFSI